PHCDNDQPPHGEKRSSISNILAWPLPSWLPAIIWVRPVSLAASMLQPPGPTGVPASAVATGTIKSALVAATIARSLFMPLTSVAFDCIEAMGATGAPVGGNPPTLDG